MYSQLSGVSLAIFAGLFDVMFFGQGTLPKDSFDFVPRYVHGISTKVMINLIILPVAGGAYHTLTVKDAPLPTHMVRQMTASGRVSRVTSVQTALRNCIRDEGGPFGFGRQGLIPSHYKLLS
jgi:hypothetical protein